MVHECDGPVGCPLHDGDALGMDGAKITKRKVSMITYASSKRCVRKASVASCRARMACDCHLNPTPSANSCDIKSVATSRT